MSFAIVLTATDVAMEITAPQMIFVGEELALGGDALHS